jgi:membrane-associated phospholipid phosphatase
MRFLAKLPIVALAIFLPRISTAQEDGLDPGSQVREVQVDAFPGEESHSGKMPAWSFIQQLASDQQKFWTAPTRMTAGSARSFITFAAFTGILMRSDTWINAQVPDRAGQLKRSLDLSNYATYSLVGIGAGSFLWGHAVHDDHLQESGLLSGEAAINATAVAYLLKNASGRPRPNDPGSGSWFQHGDSFPSEHSPAAWSVASVLAHEYPGPLTKFLAYGLASTVTLTRVTSRQHFASDAFVGSALGWYMARQVYRAHHETEAGGGPWGDFHFTSEEPGPRTQNMASPYEPLDSWVYPAFERLAALGYLHTGFLNQRPWTRLECARLVEEAGEAIPPNDSAKSPASQLYHALSQEFAGETRRLEGTRNLGVSIDSVYTRVTSISGTPLRDGFHFGQTLVNDYGRPYAEGGNVISGVATQAEAGPLAFSLRAEYQQSPAVASYPGSVLQALAAADNRPAISNASAALSQLQILESVAALDFHNTQFSFGKQSLSIGPGRSGSLLLSNNAAPFLMFRVDSTTGYEIPLLSRFLGPARSEFFLGQLAGQQYVYTGTSTLGPILSTQPFIHGERISFKPTANLEFGMGINVMFGGPGLPFTWRNFLRTYYAHSPNIADNPGKRFSSFDFSYRVPGLRNWLTIYLDSLVVDEVSPIGSTRPSLNPGLYFPRIPKIHDLEFRVEGLKTSQAPHAQFPPGYVYTDRRYLSGYTNDGQLLGSWIGRAGIGGQAWAAYHLSARNTVELSFRHMEVDHTFLRGGRLNDFSLQSQFQLRSNLSLSSLLQYEIWAFPLLANAPRSNFVTSVQLTFYPRLNRNQP